MFINYRCNAVNRNGNTRETPDLMKVKHAYAYFHLHIMVSETRTDLCLKIMKADIREHLSLIKPLSPKVK